MEVKRVRVSVACDACKKRRGKCAGTSPCDYCAEHNVPCCFSTKSKTYHYKIYNNPIMDPFLSLYAYHSAHKLNPAAMREAAAYFVGKHDFSSFANASHNDRLPDPVKEIFRFDINEMVFHVPVEETY